MKRKAKIIYDTFKVFILFTGCTLLFYYGIIWINQEYQDYHRYDKPEGSAVKVSAIESGGGNGLLERLLFFYKNGE